MRELALKVVVAVGGTSAIIGAVWAFALWAGLQPVLHFQFEALAGEVKEVKVEVIEQKLRDLRLRFATNQRDQAEYEAQGALPPAWLIQEQVTIENERETLERRLKEASE